MECIVCYSLFSKEKIPYIGVCGHSFCFQCWETTKNINLYKCPLCKKNMLQEELKKNFLAIRFVEFDNSSYISSLIDTYNECNEKFKNKLEDTKKINKEIEDLKSIRQSLINDYNKESDEIIKQTNEKTKKIVDNAKHFSKTMVLETKTIFNNIDILYKTVDQHKKNIEKSIISLQEKIKLTNLE